MVHSRYKIVSAGRFDELVIEERRASALDLLNFIGKQSHLYKSQIFTKFLEVFVHVPDLFHNLERYIIIIYLEKCIIMEM